MLSHATTGYSSEHNAQFVNKGHNRTLHLTHRRQMQDSKAGRFNHSNYRATSTHATLPAVTRCWLDGPSSPFKTRDCDPVSTF